MSAVVKNETTTAVGVRFNPGRTKGLLYGRLSCTDDEYAGMVARLRVRFAQLKDEHKLVSIEFGPRTGRWNDRLRTFEPATPADPYSVTIVTEEWQGIVL